MGMHVGKYRMKTFTEDFMKQFEEQHNGDEAETPTTSDIGKPVKGGFPDCGEGRYSAKLPYKENIQFNYAMRTHQNYVETLPPYIALFLIMGLFLPKVTMWIAFINTGARVIYNVLYMSGGPNRRLWIVGLTHTAITLFSIFSFFWALVKAINLQKLDADSGSI